MDVGEVKDWRLDLDWIGGYKATTASVVYSHLDN